MVGRANDVTKRVPKVLGSMRAGWIALAILVATTAAAVPLGAVGDAPKQLVLLVAALAAFGGVLFYERRSPFLSRRLVVGVSGGLMLLAVVTPPSSSKDIWSYVMYGRIVSVHHANSYVHAPAEYPSDPAVARMAPVWRPDRSVYGPAFTGVSAAGMAAAGDSPLAQRLFFQILSGLAVMLALLLVARRGADIGALAFIGLNPVVVAIVAGGHNDLLVGVAVLAGVLAARDGRAARAGLLLAVALLIKLTAVLALVAVVAWIGFRYGWRRAARAAIAAGVTTVVCYALAGGTTALGPLQQASGDRSKASLWSFPVSWVEHSAFGVHRANVHVLTEVALAGVVILAVLVAAARLRDRDPALAVGAALLVYLLGAAYVLPWYTGWTLPVLALAWRSRVALVAQVQAAVLVVIYVDRPGVHSALLHDVVGTIATHVVPALEAAVLIGLVAVSARRLATGRQVGRTRTRARAFA
jgi:alpha-1,6-mannosyltransferase